jgi:acyl-CoA synthetase (AMP-forming)/AMP-acid ligase II
MYLTQPLHRSASLYPKKLATICGQRRTDYGTMRDRVARLGGALRQLGVQTGDRVGLLSLNSDRYLEYFYAVYWAGAVVNPCNIRWSAAEIAYSLADCDTQVLFVDDQFLPLLPELRNQAACLKTVIHCGDGATPTGLLSYEALIANTLPADEVPRGGEDLAGIFYTGGTTGFPKGVMLPHRSLYSNGLTLVTDGFEGIDYRNMVGLHAAPMFHLADHAFTNGMAMVGATHVMVPMFNPKDVAQTIEREKVSGAVLVPTMIQMLADAPTTRDYDLSSMRFLLYGGSPIAEAVIDRITPLIPHVRFSQGYGMTELGLLATILPHDAHAGEGRAKGRLRAAGLPVMISEVRIVDEHGQEVPRGTVGEVAVRGPGMMQGYWNKPKETAEAIRNGWMHTGDGGRMDEDGYVYIADRIKDMIVTGGENVYSIEVENAAAKHPSVMQCAVIGIPDDKWGEVVHISVVVKAGTSLTLAELQEHCKSLIANYKMPRVLELVDALPISGAGKILKNKLREKHWAGRDRKVG